MVNIGRSNSDTFHTSSPSGETSRVDRHVHAPQVTSPPKRDRSERHCRAEPDVDDLVVDDEHHVRGRPRRHRITHAHSSDATADRIAELLEDRGEQRVVLIAVTASSPIDELCLERVDVETDLAAEADVEVLVRDVLDVSALQRRQRDVGPVESDAREIAIDVQSSGTESGSAAAAAASASAGAPASDSGASASIAASQY